MQFKTLLLETSDGVATLTVNRPEALNALNSALLAELECALLQLDLDAAVKVVIITGAGEKAFVAGADIKEMCGMSSLAAHAFMRTGQRVMLLIERLKKPVDRGRERLCPGGRNGIGPGLRLHLRLRKSQVRSSRGGTGHHAGLRRHPEPGPIDRTQQGQGAGFHRQNDHGPEGPGLGHRQRGVRPRRTDGKDLGNGQGDRRQGPLGVRYAKDAVANGLNMAKEDGFRYEASLLGVLFSTEDQREGMDAFIAKRKAEFQGKIVQLSVKLQKHD